MPISNRDKHTPTQEVPSKEYGAALLDAKQVHYGKTCTGQFLRPHAPYIKHITDRHQVSTILDYGAGKGMQYTWVNPDDGLTLSQYWGIPDEFITKYDPAFPPYAAEPNGQYDMVLCTHVLGMIPLVDHAWVIDRLYQHARKALYIAERLDPPRKLVGDPAKRPANQGWGHAEWQANVQRAGSEGIEVTLCTRVTGDDGGKTHLMSKWDGKAWSQPRQMVSRGYTTRGSFADGLPG